MSSETIDVEVHEGVADSYLARPDDSERHPGVLLIGTRSGCARRSSGWLIGSRERGFVVLAPNVFYRAGRAPVLAMPDLEDPDERARLLAVAATAHAVAHSRADRARRRRPILTS